MGSPMSRFEEASEAGEHVCRHVLENVFDKYHRIAGERDQILRKKVEEELSKGTEACSGTGIRMVNPIPLALVKSFIEDGRDLSLKEYSPSVTVKTSKGAVKFKLSSNEDYWKTGKARHRQLVDWSEEVTRIMRHHHAERFILSGIMPHPQPENYMCRDTFVEDGLNCFNRNSTEPLSSGTLSLTCIADGKNCDMTVIRGSLIHMSNVGLQFAGDVWLAAAFKTARDMMGSIGLIVAEATKGMNVDAN